MEEQEQEQEKEQEQERGQGRELGAHTLMHGCIFQDPNDNKHYKV
jgi:hypothetical protein